MTVSTALLKQVEQHPRFIAAQTILCYHSLGDEVQTHAFVEKWHITKKILLPVVVGDILELRHYTGKDCLKVGAFGIEEPTGKNFTNFDEIEFGIIPGVSFDKQGNYSLGLKEQTVFPEITFEDSAVLHGLEITFIIKNGSKEGSTKLLEMLGMPFEKEEK